MLREVIRERYARLFARLYTRFRNIELVEDALQDAAEKAAARWDRTPPADPAAWLYVAARNRIVDMLRAGGKVSEELPETGAPSQEIEALEAGRTLDEQLRLMCMCCHPALAERAQVLLTLKLVAGLTVDEIAAALLMKPKTVAQTLTRSKAKIARAGIPFEVADESHLAERIATIQRVLYLLFNEGYHSNSEQPGPLRVDLCVEAIRLARLLVAIERDIAESTSLLCLMLYQHSRSAARESPDGQPILLADQDRSRWDRTAIEEADRLLERVVATIHAGRGGRYAIQAAIAREHAHAASFDRSDWRQICQLYSELYLLQPDPIVLLAWLGAESYRSSPALALELIERHGLEQHLQTYRWFYSTRAELQKRTGDLSGAARDLRRAIELSKNRGELKFLQRRLGELADNS